MFQRLPFLLLAGLDTIFKHAILSSSIKPRLQLMKSISSVPMLVGPLHPDLLPTLLIVSANEINSSFAIQYLIIEKINTETSF